MQRQHNADGRTDTQTDDEHSANSEVGMNVVVESRYTLACQHVSAQSGTCELSAIAA